MTDTEQINARLYRRLRSGEAYDALMPFSSCQQVALGSGDTGFGLQEMQKWILKYAYQTEKLAPKLKGRKIFDTCKKIKDFAYWHFQYKLDGALQQLRSPACAWQQRQEGIDCKSYSIFISTVLLNLGVPHYLRRIKQNNDFPNNFTHVYVVVPKNGSALTGGYYTLDGTIEPMRELPYLVADDLFISPQKGLGVPLSQQKIKLWDDVLQTLTNLQQIYPQNTDIQQLKTQIIHLKKTNKPFLFSVKNFVLTLEGKPYALFPNTGLGNASLDDFTQLTIDQVTQRVEMRSQMIKQATAGTIGAVGSAAAGVANLFPGVGQIVAACIEVVTLLGQLWAMYIYDPCAGSEYMPKPIGERLKHEFTPVFKKRAGELQEALENFTIAGQEITITEILREIDLGVAHFNNEKMNYNDNPCGVQTLADFTGYVQQIKTVVDNMYYAIKAMLKGHFKFEEEDVEAMTSDRHWYFIVPTTTRPVRATYRKVKIRKWNENLKVVYPYASEHSFAQWVELNRRYLNTIYGDKRGDRYFQTALPFGKQIETIRKNIYLPANLRMNEEEKIRKQMRPLYLEYDTDYAQSLEKTLQQEVHAINQRQADFLQELRTINQQMLDIELRRRANVKIIADSNNNYKSEHLSKQLLGLGLLAATGVVVAKELNN